MDPEASDLTRAPDEGDLIILAREFLQRADAVVWLFTVNQAGKSTEKRALDSIRDEGVRVLGVLNKIDQLSAEEVTQLASAVEAGLNEDLTQQYTSSLQSNLEVELNEELWQRVSTGQI